MTNEDKQLLLIDLCARLPYKAYIEIVDEGGNVYDEVELEPHHINTVRYDESISIRPYLRPMSSITEEEADEFEKISNELLENGTSTEIWSTAVDWLNSHQFDYRIDPLTGKTLIESGIALKAPDGMYINPNKI